MTVSRTGRYFYWIARDLLKRHTKSLLAGFSAGFVISLIFWQFSTVISHYLFSPHTRIGIVGDYQPETLPVSIQSRISQGLTVLGDDGSAKPGLASWWEATASGKSYVFHIREDATWHDGRPVDARDINYNIKNVTFIIPDSKTIRAELDYPYSAFPVLVSKPLFRSGLVGLGSYRVSRMKMNGDSIAKLTLSATAGENTKGDITYTFYRTETQAIMAYKLGEIDEIADITNPSALVEWGNTKIVERVLYNRIVALLFNTDNKILSERAFRLALGYAMPALPQEKALSPIPSTSWAYSEKVRKFEPDPAQVKKQLGTVIEATESPKLTLLTFNSYLETAQSIVNAWNTQGISATVKVANSVPKNYELLLTAIDVPSDPDQYPFWHSTQISSGTNITNYANVKIDKLLEDGRQKMDTAERKKIYADFARFLVDDAPAIFLYYPKTYSVVRG